MKNYKHYIRLNANSEVVYGFSSGFEAPQEADILLCETDERHFGTDESTPNLLPLMGADNKPRWKWDGLKLVSNT